MKTKYFTKQRLIVINEIARKAGGRYIDPAFLQTLPENLKYPVGLALPVPQERGWYRYWVLIGTSMPLREDNFYQLMLDMPQTVFESLPVAVEEEARS